jgi:hypothetical protein
MKIIHLPFQFKPRTLSSLLLLAILPALIGPGCTALAPYLTPASPTPPPTTVDSQPSPEPTASPRPSTAAPAPETEVIFRVRVPGSGLDENPLYLSLLDEVTGLGLNAEHYPMQQMDTGADDDPYRSYHLNLSLPVGGAIKYRYEYGSGSSRVLEYVTDGKPVRYRVLHVEGPGLVDDVVARWSNTRYEGPTGRITGRALDASSGSPVPNILVSSAGEQTITALDGTFVLEGLPPGLHNLVALAMDGSYRTFQQGARVAEESTTPAVFNMLPAHYVTVTFLASLPGDTPPLVPLRMAGSLRQFGNTFAGLEGDTSLLAAHMPILTPMPDGRMGLTLRLPAGADLSYKYTLGDGFWNAEHARDGAFVIRRLVVPEEDTLIEDLVERWQSSAHPPISFDLSVPSGTPEEDPPAIQFRMLLGWTEPIPMWRLAENRYVFVLFSPLNLPGDLAYRYCYHGYCTGKLAPEQGQVRPVVIEESPVSIKDAIQTWPEESVIPQDVEVIPAAPVLRDSFIAGLELQPAYRYAWTSRLPQFLTEAKELGAGYAFLTPTWTFSRSSPPQMEALPVEDPGWDDLLYAAELVHEQGLRLALFPTPHFTGTPSAYWHSGERSFRWWSLWFDRYSSFLRNQADLAERAGADLLILGGDWIAPALPGGRLDDGSPSGVPADADLRWERLVGEVREIYSGQIYWAHPAGEVEDLPDLIDQVDGVYLLWPLTLGEPSTVFEQSPEAAAGRFLDGIVRPLMLLYGKPVLIGAAFEAGDDPQAQFEAYSSLLNLVNQRPWIEGLVSRGYTAPYPAPASPASVRGQPAAALLAYWFPLFSSTR